MSDRANLFGVNCNISLVGFIVLLCLVHEKKKHMDTFEKLRVIIAVKIRESVGNEGGLRRGLEAASRKEEASSLGYIPRCAVAESLWFKHFWSCSPKCLCAIKFPPAMYEELISAHPCQHLTICRFDYSLASEWYLVFYLHFPNDLWWRRQWHPTLVLLPGKSHGRKSRVGCSPRGH